MLLASGFDIYRKRTANVYYMRLPLMPTRVADAGQCSLSYVAIASLASKPRRPLAREEGQADFDGRLLRTGDFAAPGMPSDIEGATLALAMLCSMRRPAGFSTPLFQFIMMLFIYFFSH